MHPRSLHLNHAASFFLKVLVNGIWLHVNISTHIADSINYAISNKGFLLRKVAIFTGITVRGLNLLHIISQLYKQ